MGIMKQIVNIYDNGGKTADRYTVIIDGAVYTMSDNATAPNGVNMYAGELKDLPNAVSKDDEFLGDDVLKADIPDKVKDAILLRMGVSLVS